MLFSRELYFEAEVKIRCQIAVAQDIRVKLIPGSARSELFRGTCFGPWLDVRSTSNDSNLVHLILQTQYIPVVHQDALFFRVGGRELRFGPQEFCLITGMRFGPYHWGREGADMTFRERVFGHVQARLKVSDLKNVFDRSLDQLSDLDAVRLCLLMLLEVGFMGRESSLMVDLALLQLVEDLESWNKFPWGSYVWKVVYEQLHNALGKRSARLASIPITKKLNYSLHGFIWAFKIWIFEVFPYARRFATKHGGIPRAISWDKKQCIKWMRALPFVMDATVPGFKPLPVLTPTSAERATEWWKASCLFFDNFANDSSPPSKKARLSSQHQPSVKVYDQLVDDIANNTTIPVEDIGNATTMPIEDIADTTIMSAEDIVDTTTMPTEDIADTSTMPTEDIADTTTMPVEDIADATTMPVEDIADATTMPVKDIVDATTMPTEDIADTTTVPSSNNTTSHQTMEWMANMEKKMLEIKELWKARQPHCVKTETPMTSDVFGLSDHEEDCVEAGKVSSQSNIICVQGYRVKQSVAPILESIFNKHGDIAAECVFKPASMRSSFLEIVCEIVNRIQTNDDIEKMEEIEQQVLATEAANINVSWLHAHLEAIRKRNEEGKKCSLLMEVKANTVLVKKAAQMDLSERCVELVAAQERFEEAERHVRVLHLVEKNLNDNILESKANIDSWARQPVL